MSTILNKTAWIRFVLALFFLCDLGTVRALAQDLNYKVTKVEYSGETVYIFYDLEGPLEDVYQVSLVMKKHSDSTFVYTPKFATGDVGSSMFSGTGWRISWNYLREYPGGIDQKDMYFAVYVRRVGVESSSRGSNTFLWIAGGAVVAGGLVAVLLLSSGGNGSNGPSTVFPAPPGRPSN
jgi:hypothetical protein